MADKKQAFAEEMTTLDLSKTPDPKPEALPNEELQIDVIDDTPPADRGKVPMEANPEPDEDEVESYSAKVKQRIEKLTKAYHDERRAKEQADRERAEALKYAQSIVEKNKTLVTKSNSDSTLLHQTWKSKTETDLARAKQQYKAAYETGDSEKIVEAQEELNRATMRHEIAINQQPALQAEPEGVKEKPQESVYTAPTDERAVQWAKDNPWFGKDRLMTSLAYGLHEELVASGLHPQRDAKTYYAKINETMRKHFPEYEWADKPPEQDPEAKPRPRPNATVVAPVTRTATGRRVALTQTQVAIAKRLNIPLAEYAKQVAALQGGNNG